ncbi:hypothetical protein Hypma_016598 [Hypsizygus marmoreus]|uniref:Uncharacterized protein n=1 Tax=Hypsizygus marmoreus TaxID=39966 RepID=A0A369J2J1_HYPMA|nr:hypothetical protein Hypma_016598 [Hypsizygus marmoreus]
MTSPGFDHLHRVAVFVDLFDANNPYPLRLDDNARVIEGLEELLRYFRIPGFYRFSGSSMSSKAVTER